MALALVLSGARIRFEQPCGSPKRQDVGVARRASGGCKPALGTRRRGIELPSARPIYIAGNSAKHAQTAMGARRIFEGIALPPDVMRTAVKSFDALWLELVDCFDAQSQDTARETLAEAVISALQKRPNFLDNIRTDAIRTRLSHFRSGCEHLRRQKVYLSNLPQVGRMSGRVRRCGCLQQTGCLVAKLAPQTSSARNPS